jgi:hypothetical protein
MAKLSNAQVNEIRERWRRGEELKAMASDYDVHPSHLSRVVRGLRRPPEGDQRLPDASERPQPPRPEPKVRIPRKPRIGPTRAEKVRLREEARAEHEALWERAVQLYEEGHPTTEIARRIGRDSSRVSVNLRMRGVQMRAPHSYEPEIDRDAVRRWHAEGIRATEMMRRLGIGRIRLYQVFDELSLPRFGSGRPSPTQVGGGPQ